MMDTRNRILDALGDVINYPANDVEEAKERLERAMELYKTKFKKYTNEERMVLIAEIELMEDQISWDKGYSDLKDENGEEDYLMFIVPGELYPNINSTNPKHKREYQKEIRRDLARYYKYSPAMRAKKRKLIKDLSQSSFKLHNVFGKYGKDIVLSHGEINVSYQDLLNLDDAIQRLIYEDKYIIAAKGIRNPFVPDYYGFKGRYRKIVVSFNTRLWFTKEPVIVELLKYLESSEDEYEDEDNEILLTRSGLLIYCSLEIIIRLALLDKGERYIREDGSVSTRYPTTLLMRNILKAPEYIDVFGVAKFARTLIIEPVSEIEIEFMENKDIMDTENISYQRVIEEMGYIQTFYDIKKSE